MSRIILCSIDNCTRPRLARGWCEAHYRRWRRHGAPLAGRTRARTHCSVDGCPNRHNANGYCPMHYQRVQRHGDPEYLTFTEVDDAVVERAIASDWTGQLTVAERETVIRRLHRLGLSDRQIAEHLDIGTSGVSMARRRLRLPANRRPIGDFSGRAAA
ncbi:hypothetical protein GCM10010406_21590 [Streptomyces thermolineatus]|uniref:Uncharacterized protein n=1 Tax=Streptomyces thermolineatus TaxID=44033 RepID=A0ABP5YXE9_9ACTN